MLTKKLRNIALSLNFIALWVSVILFLSAQTNKGDISPLYIWMKLTILLAGFSGLLMLALRIFKVITRANFLYTFLGTANMMLGLSGVYFYILGKINMIGLHDTIPNLFVGVVVLTDIFLFESIFKNDKIS
jgi:hypothetical protein